MFSTRRSFLRFDVRDRMLRYPGPTFDTGGTVRNAAFFSHDLPSCRRRGMAFLTVAVNGDEM